MLNSIHPVKKYIETFKGEGLKAKDYPKKKEMDEIIKKLPQISLENEPDLAELLSGFEKMKTYDPKENFSNLKKILRQSKKMIEENVSNISKIKLFLKLSDELFINMGHHIQSSDEKDDLDKLVLTQLNNYFNETNIFTKIRLAYDISSVIIQNI